MSRVSRPAAATSTAERIEIVPIRRQHIAGFHAAVDAIAKERRYLAMLEAPSLTHTRRRVLDSLRSGAVHVVAVVDDEIVGPCATARCSAWGLSRHFGAWASAVAC
jgi:hypothetical protein